MIFIVGSEYKKFMELPHTLDYYSFCPYPPGYRRAMGLNERIVGNYRGEEVFLCPCLSIDREEGACNRCRYRFRCFTERWGFDVS